MDNQKDEDKRAGDGGEPTPLEATSPRPTPSLGQATWKQVQQEIDFKVAEAMKDFYSIHSKALLRVERIIERDLLPKLESKASGNLREIADLVRRLLLRVENLRPVFRLQLDEGTEKQAVVDKLLHATNGLPEARPSPNADEKPQTQGTTTTATDVIFRNPRWKKQRRDGGAPVAKAEERRLYKERERAQFEVNLVLLKKSLFSLQLNRNNRYWPRSHWPARDHRGPIHRPVDPAALYG
ncbi:uncharacterized protein LOC108033103 [Drosophila biarmipes]|uniref:uncharacterized protein LOC108033103 n=1 Tax=Drosophila biarmipes TaxID=125945 RepID=UPI0007E7FBB0|nr:uncharacterized protein LOC108033103 [Drosophila biarmipes]